jgi:serine protease AprX
MVKNVYKLLAVLSVLSFLLAGVVIPASAAPWRDKVDPWVLSTASQGQTEFLVFLSSQADLSRADSLSTKLEKGTYVYQTLSAFAARTQAPIIAELVRLGVEYRPYWIANMIWVRSGLSTVQLLAQRTDVAHLYANPQVKMDVPAVQASSAPSPQGVEWNITKVKAPDVWAMGFTGQGVVIGGQDTGYQWDHPALINQYRGWNDGIADHDYNWHDAIHENAYFNTCGFDSPFPCDDYGHGTHTMGTMVGDDGGANQIGMAPGARWIGCRNMDNGVGSPSTYAECYQWFVAPTRIDGSEPRPDLAPDVINNSWGCPTSEGCNPDSLLVVVQNLVNAGIVTAHSAGNDGSGCSTVNTPGAIYEESFTVGATDSSDIIASFSSRGPVTVDGSNRPKPDISAPGVSIRSSVPGDGYQGGWSGTSMAAPHVAGLVALLISAHPDLDGQVAQIESLIEQSAFHISWSGCSSSGVPNSAYGWGRIDALAAVGTVHQLELAKVASDAVVFPGDLITYTLTVTHSNGIGSTTNVVLTDTLPAGTTFVSATQPYSFTGDVVRWDFPSLDTPESVNVDLTVGVNITSTGTIVNDDYAVKSDQVEQVLGEPVSTQLDKLDFLQLDKTASASMVIPGELITYTLTVTNSQSLISASNLVLTDNLPVGATFVSASGPYTRIGDVIRWDYPTLDASTTLSVVLVVRVELTTVGLLTNADYAVYSDQAALVQGAPVSVRVGSVFFLPIAIKAP